MLDRPRLMKLLETATHPTATDNERLNALNAFRRISDRSGGLGDLFSISALEKAKNELETLQAAMVNTLLENSQLKTERDALVQKLSSDRSKQTRDDRKNSHDPNAGQKSIYAEKLVLSVLSKDWQELHRIQEAMKKVGFMGTSAELRQILDRLCFGDEVVCREPGTFPDSTGLMRWQAKSWKAKKHWTQAFRR